MFSLYFALSFILLCCYFVYKCILSAKTVTPKRVKSCVKIGAERRKKNEHSKPYITLHFIRKLLFSYCCLLI